MAAVPVIINGVLMPKAKGGSDKPVPAVFIGYASIAGLEVGGGPIIPPDQPPIDPPIDPPTEPSGGNIAIVIKPAPATGGWGLAQQGAAGPLQWYFVPAVTGPKR
jgi:hypothetical protein